MVAVDSLEGDGGGGSVEGLLAELVEEGGGEVALAGAGDDHDDQLASMAGFLRDLEGCVDGGSGGDSD